MINYFLDRTKKPKVRKPIRKVGKKRSKANAEYAKRRKAFLKAHPYCQWWIMENMKTTIEVFGFDFAEDLVIAASGLIRSATGYIKSVPLATEIHHKKKPKCKYLNDESTWMAVSREGHEWIEANKKLARERGYLENN